MYKFEPYVKFTDQVVNYFDRVTPQYDRKYWTVEENNIKGIIDKINKGIPLPQINYDVKENKIIEGTDTYIALSLLVNEQVNDIDKLYVNIEQCIITENKDSEYDIPVQYFFDTLKLLRYQRTIPNITDAFIDKIDKMHAKLSRYKIVVNELYKL